MCGEMYWKLYNIVSYRGVVLHFVQCQEYFTLGFALRIQEEISRIPVDVLRTAMSSVHDRLAECEQRNGGHLEVETSGMKCCIFFYSVLCFKTTDSLISANAKVCTSL